MAGVRTSYRERMVQALQTFGDVDAVPNRRGGVTAVLPAGNVRISWVRDPGRRWVCTAASLDRDLPVTVEASTSHPSAAAFRDVQTAAYAAVLVLAAACVRLRRAGWRVMFSGDGYVICADERGKKVTFLVDPRVMRQRPEGPQPLLQVQSDHGANHAAAACRAAGGGWVNIR